MGKWKNALRQGLGFPDATSSYHHCKPGIWFFVITSMAAMGLQLTAGEIVAPLKRRWLVFISLFANFFIVPLLAVFMVRVIPVEPGIAAGLLIVAAAAGAPSLPKTMEIIGGNVAFALGLTILLVIITIFYMPLVLPLMLPGVLVNQSTTVLCLIGFMLVPLLVAMWYRMHFPQAAERYFPRLDLISTVSIIFIFIPYIIALFTTDFSARTEAGIGLIGTVVAIVFIIGAFTIGYLLGGPDIRDRETLAFGTGFRNVSAALVVVTVSFTDPTVVFMVLVIAFFGIICMMVLGALFLRRNQKLAHSGKTGELM